MVNLLFVLFYVRSPMRSEKLFRFGKFFVVGGENGVFQIFARFRIQGMRDVLEFPFARAPAGHGDERTVRSFDHFDVMYNKTIVDRDRRNRFEFTVLLFHEADANI